VAFLRELITIRDSSLTLSGLLFSDKLNDIISQVDLHLVGFWVCLFACYILYIVYDLNLSNTVWVFLTGVLYWGGCVLHFEKYAQMGMGVWPGGFVADDSVQLVFQLCDDQRRSLPNEGNYLELYVMDSLRLRHRTISWVF